MKVLWCVFLSACCVASSLGARCINAIHNNDNVTAPNKKAAKKYICTVFASESKHFNTKTHQCNNCGCLRKDHDNT